jgi:hypothetical protein
MNYEDSAIVEVHEIVKTVEFVLASSRVFRIEVVMVAKGTATVHYDARYYEQKTLYKTRDGAVVVATPVAGEVEFYVWVPDHDLPSINRDSAEGALQQARDYLSGRRNNQNTNW